MIGVVGMCYFYITVGLWSDIQISSQKDRHLQLPAVGHSEASLRRETWVASEAWKGNVVARECKQQMVI